MGSLCDRMVISANQETAGYLFSGQGSQYIGMGESLFQAFTESRAVFEAADETLGFSLSKLCFEGPQDELTKTNNCQPAILTVSIAAFRAFQLINKGQSDKTIYAAGLSLGEYSALVAAGAISFEDAVYLVRRRGELMEEEARNAPGAMVSIIGLDLDKIRQLCRESGAEIANINCPGQVVISGGVKEVDEASRIAQEAGAKRVIRLEVSGAFHSSLMKGASLKLALELDKVKIVEPKMTVISNVTAAPVVSPEEIKENLIKQVSSSVLWEDSIKLMLSKGVINFYEFGPGKVLKGLMRRINEGASVVCVEKKEDLLTL